MRGWLTRLLGNRGERLAAKFLVRKGIRILRRQHKMPSGELDIIAMDGDRIVFVEVKTRRSDSKGHPVEAITPQKQKKLTQLALTYLKKHGLLNQPTRFDVVTVLWKHGQRKPVIEHYENAFPPVGSGQMFS
jgi:putative endonuclease